MALQSALALAQQASAEDVYAPLVDAAQADLLAGRAALAHARAQAALTGLPNAGPRANAARRIRSEASLRLEPGEEQPSVEAIYEPMVTQAESDGAGGRRQLAWARLSAVLEAVPPGSALAERARNLFVILTDGNGQTPPEQATPGVVPPPPPADPVPPPPPAPLELHPTSPTSPPAHPLAETAAAPPAAPADPDRRTDEEASQFYISSFGLGAFAGTYLLAISDAEALELYLMMPVLMGLGFGFGAMALDMDPGMRQGVPTAFTAGTLLGLSEGFLLWGAFSDNLESDEVWSLLLSSSLVGTALGGLYGYAARPTVAESLFMGAAGAWGVWLASMSALAIEWKGGERLWRPTMVGFSVGVGVAAILAAATNISKERIYVINGSMAGGALLGLMVAGIIRLDAERREKPMAPEAFAASLAIGSAAGLAISFVFEDEEFDDEDEEEEGDQASLRPGSFHLGGAPLEGGAMILGTGVF